MPVVEAQVPFITISEFCRWAKIRMRDLHEQYSLFSLPFRSACQLDGRTYHFSHELAQVARQIEALHASYLSPTRAYPLEIAKSDVEKILSEDTHIDFSAFETMLTNLIHYLQRCLFQGKPSDAAEVTLLKEIYASAYIARSNLRGKNDNTAAKSLCYHLLRFRHEEFPIKLYHIALNDAIANNNADDLLLLAALYPELNSREALLSKIASTPDKVILLERLYCLPHFDFRWESSRIHKKTRAYGFSHPYINAVKPESSKHFVFFNQMLQQAIMREDSELLNFLITRQPMTFHFAGFLFEQALQQQSKWAREQLSAHGAIINRFHDFITYRSDLLKRADLGFLTEPNHPLREAIDHYQPAKMADKATVGVEQTVAVCPSTSVDRLSVLYPPSYLNLSSSSSAFPVSQSMVTSTSLDSGLGHGFFEAPPRTYLSQYRVLPREDIDDDEFVDAFAAKPAALRLNTSSSSSVERAKTVAAALPVSSNSGVTSPSVKSTEAIPEQLVFPPVPTHTPEPLRAFDQNPVVLFAPASGLPSTKAKEAVLEFPAFT